ncbi:MAG TPA: periplasmic heavy metal sensor [Bryobacteraceae bacterium]|nr:periplasmic heavy metal sensor [Bryobacteraceae bacterium]
MKSYAFALSLFFAGALFAQTPAVAPANPGQHPHMRPRGNPDDFFEARLTRSLGLNATQQNTVHTVLLENRTMSKGFGQQLQTLHSQMVTAVKNGDESTIDSVTTQMSSIRQQQEALHAKAMAKIYAALTPDQKTKVGANLEMLMGRGGMGFGFGSPAFRPPLGPSQPKQ